MDGNRLPFGVAQVGKAFRNEIAPRAGLTRQREFTQAEIEWFVNPKNKSHTKFRRIADLRLMLFPSDRQLAGQSTVAMALGDAVSAGVINNETLGYMIARTHAFLVSVGILPEHLRFRQHLPTEMAHYACDCWDAEIQCSYGWLECVGIADRACFDLNAHAMAARCDLQYRETLDTPIERDVLVLTKKSGIDVMKSFKKEGKAVKEWLESLEQDALQALANDVSQNGSKAVQVNGSIFELTRDLLAFETKKERQTVHSFTPGVVEPSFGIDRIMTAALEHSYYARPKDVDSDDKQTRGVLSLSASIAPYKCTLLSLDQRISRDQRFAKLSRGIRERLVGHGLSYTTDDSGVSLGKRYARNDELGIPFAITIDFDTLESGIVTLRERDTMDQAKMLDFEVVDRIADLCVGAADWESILVRHTHRRCGHEEWTMPS